MAKTHEALLRAEKEYQEKFIRPAHEPKKMKVVRPPKRTSSRTGMESYEDLKTNLLSRNSDGSVKSILFNGTYHGGGCSTTVVNLASALTKDSDLKVLLLDVNLRTPGLHDAFKIDQDFGLTDFLSNGCQTEPQIKKVEPGNLHVLTCGGKASVPLALFESNEFDQFLKDVREKFDFVILDAPPMPKFAECRVLCTKVDGVVLVIEAGKTRRHVALRAIKELEEAGANLLGVVINKRKYYIPDWIYRLL
jgi:capsular exopolysaccharide synthesis family protein